MLFSRCAMGITENIASVRQRMAAACHRAGRNPRDVTVLAVTKRSPPDDIRVAVGAGITAIGESRVLESIDKFRELPPVEKHLIGHLQSNKARLAVQYFDVIQSVDSLKLAKEIHRHAPAFGKVMPVMIEVQFEEQKHGVPPDEVHAFYKELLKLTDIKVIGLMTMAPLVPAEETRPYFRKMRELNERLGLRHLSMGMSNDFEVAVDEGSTMVRIGTAIFG